MAKIDYYDIKNYIANKLNDKESSTSEEAEVYENMRRSYSDSEVYNPEIVIYAGTKVLSLVQIRLLEKMAEDLNLEYMYFQGYHQLYKITDFSELPDFKSIK